MCGSRTTAGRRLSYSNMEVTANGDAADYIGEMDRQTYSVKLKEGANEIRVLARDVYQYAIVKTWTVYYKAGKGEITISLEGGTVGIPYFIRPQKMEVSDGENLAQVVERFLTAKRLFLPPRRNHQGRLLPIGSKKEGNACGLFHPKRSHPKNRRR